MIRETVCGWLVWSICWIFGMETFSIAVCCSLPNPVLYVLDQYIQEVPE